MNWLRRICAPRQPARIGALRLDHVDRLAEIHAGAFARPWTTTEFESFLLDRSVRADGLFLGRSLQPAGFALSRLVEDEAEILSVALHRSARRLGHSGNLLRHHLQTLAHDGVARVHLEVEEGNLPALALYRRLGFAQSGVRPDYYARPDGSRAAALSMTRYLATPAESPLSR